MGSAMLKVFLEVVLPVALVAVVGGLVGRWRNVPVPPVSALAFYLFSPALVFHSLATTSVSADVSVKIVLVMLASYVAMYAASTAWSLVMRHPAPMRAAFALGATTPNVGNMGLPVALLAFGQPGLQVAVMNFVAGSLMANSAGLVVASTAGGVNWGQIWRVPFRYPALYAALAGIAVNVLKIHLPTAIDSPINSLQVAAVPVMLVVLGLQLRDAGGRDHVVDTVAVNVGRLTIAPVIAWFAATALGLDGVTRATLVVLAAMPTAVIATIVATEFKAEPTFVTRVVVTSTLLCMVTLSVLISIVR